MSGNPQTCIPTGTSLSLTEIGPSIDETTAINGILDIGGTLYVVNREVNSIFRVMLAPQIPFLRGDVAGTMLPNGTIVANGLLESADVVMILGYLFASGQAPVCLDAADLNDDGAIDISDPTYLIFYLFLSGENPAAPFPVADVDPTPLDPLGC